MNQKNTDIFIVVVSLILALAIWGIITYLGYASGADTIGFPLSYFDRTPIFPPPFFARAYALGALVDVVLYFLAIAWILRKLVHLKK